MPRSRRHRRAAFWIAATVLVVCAGAVLLPKVPGALGWGRYGFGPPLKVKSLAEVTHWTELKFPADAQLVEGYWLGGQSPYQIAKVRMPHRRVKGFLAQHPINGEASSTEVDSLMEGGLDVMRHDGMVVPHPRRFRSTSRNLDPGSLRVVAVLVDLDDPATAVVYTYYYA